MEYDRDALRATVLRTEGDVAVVDMAAALAAFGLGSLPSVAGLDRADSEAMYQTVMHALQDALQRELPGAKSFRFVGGKGPWSLSEGLRTGRVTPEQAGQGGKDPTVVVGEAESDA